MRIFSLYFFMAIAYASPPSITKKYRPDYEYNSDTDAFYKLHTDSAFFLIAKWSCIAEGAGLMFPEYDQDLNQLHGMFKKFPDIGDYVWVAKDGKVHESAEEQPLIDLSESLDTEEQLQILRYYDVVNRKGEVRQSLFYKRHPFICKVEAKDAPYDDHCDVYAAGYQYIETVGSCYKVSSVAYPWNEAYDECQAENAHLVVLNSEAEMLAVKALIKAASPALGAKEPHFFYGGFRAKKPAGDYAPEFRTIFNQTLEEAGYSGWTENEPNNSHYVEYCGSLFLGDGKFNDVNCAHKFAFVCEKEVRP